MFVPKVHPIPQLFFSRVPPHISAEELGSFFSNHHKTVVDVDFFRNAITQESKVWSNAFTCHRC